MEVEEKLHIIDDIIKLISSDISDHCCPVKVPDDYYKV